ncbi:MAG TPA: mucin-2 protein [Marmoricola sp.]|nr:mucin-2 protein [Marmoricola sp.]
MAHGRHRASHKLDRPKNAAVRAASVAAPVVTAGAVGMGMIGGTGVVTAGEVQIDQAATTISHKDLVESRRVATSRSASRPVTAHTILGAGQLRVADKKFTTAELDLRKAPAADAVVDGTVDPAAKVVATGQQEGAFAEVEVDGEFYWVTAKYLSDTKPDTPETMGLSMKPCPTSGVEAGLTSNADRVHRAVCNAFPQITTYGGRDNHGEHVSGKAIDIMTSDPVLGTKIAEFLRAHAAELHLYDVIWRQHIWTPVRASEGWRSMSNRGSATANHYDHVHVSVY